MDYDDINEGDNNDGDNNYELKGKRTFIILNSIILLIIQSN